VKNCVLSYRIARKTIARLGCVRSFTMCVGSGRVGSSQEIWTHVQLRHNRLSQVRDFGNKVIGTERSRKELLAAEMFFGRVSVVRLGRVNKVAVCSNQAARQSILIHTRMRRMSQRHFELKSTAERHSNELGETTSQMRKKTESHRSTQKNEATQVPCLQSWLRSHL